MLSFFPASQVLGSMMLPSVGARCIALAGFAGAGTYVLLTEHYARTMQALPWLFVLAAPLMHVFMHRNHGPQRPEARGLRAAEWLLQITTVRLKIEQNQLVIRGH